MLDLRAITVATRVEHAAGRLPAEQLGDVANWVRMETAGLPEGTASGRLQQASVLAAGASGLLEKAADWRVMMGTAGGLWVGGRTLQVRPAIVAEQAARADTAAFLAIALLHEARATVAADGSLGRATAAIDATIDGATALRTRLAPFRQFTERADVAARPLVEGHAGAAAGADAAFWSHADASLGLRDGRVPFLHRAPNEQQLAARLLAPEQDLLGRARTLGTDLAQQADELDA